MSDNELDELLNAWKTPPVPGSLRAAVEDAIAVGRRKPRKVLRSWRLVFASAAVIAVVFVLTNTSAFPQKTPPPPYTVDSEIVLHPGSEECLGTSLSSRCWMVSGPQHALMTSYNRAGSEVLVSWSAPDEPVAAAFWTAKLTVSDLIGRFTRRFLLTPDQEAERGDFAVFHSQVGQSWSLGERVPLVDSGCRPSPRHGEVVGQEVILNYPTVEARFDEWTKRMTLSMAPDLSCFALRATVEVKQEDNRWNLVSEKKALKVNR